MRCKVRVANGGKSDAKVQVGKLAESVRSGLIKRCWMGIGSLRMMSDITTSMGFEPTRGDPNGLAVHRLNRSATMSSTEKFHQCPEPIWEPEENLT